MKVYNYHPITKAFLGSVELSEGDRNPFDKNDFLIPANAVKKWPTVSAGENQAIIFNGLGWSLTPDFRGVESWHQTGEEIEITELGQTLPIDSINYDPVALADEKTEEYEQAQAEAQAVIDAITEEQPINE
ncbi:hypothetical protein [Marinomonas foliarum]|uniref:Tail fiber assembly-like protein n=2 Tax=root TaxID=1 RepID=A0A899ISQ2_9VIRU|nr:hypothetical protein [Marinomonas foliarum]QRV22801.1 hypothetical protein JSY38_12055 [Marinomonas foliarum]QSM01476.1 tail fiber assembly-like protein [Marinomonas phage MfV]